MKPLTRNVLLTSFVVLLLRSVLSQSYYTNNKLPARHLSPSNRFPQLTRVLNRLDPEPRARLTEGAPTPTPGPWRPSAGHVRPGGVAAVADDSSTAPKDHHSYPATLSTHRPHTQQERETSTEGRVAGGAAPPMSSYSQMKWNTFGRRPNLETYRNSRMNANKPHPSSDDTQRALQHSLLMSREAVCKVPRPRVVNVKDLHPHPGKSYVPHCTVLHRCGDDTACCRADTDSCLPARTQTVELYFYSSTATGRSSVVEKLRFVNHTECSCRDKYEDQMPRDMGSGSGTPPGPRHRHAHAHAHAHEHAHAHAHAHAQGQDTPAWAPWTPHVRQPAWPHAVETQPTASYWDEPCRCPKEFQPLLGDASCTCECIDKQHDCVQQKNGTRYFTHQDKICIEKNHCQAPRCEFGPYLRQTGRCARKHEFSSWSTQATAGHRSLPDHGLNSPSNYGH